MAPGRGKNSHTGCEMTGTGNVQATHKRPAWPEWRDQGAQYTIMSKSDGKQIVWGHGVWERSLEFTLRSPVWSSDDSQQEGAWSELWRAGIMVVEGRGVEARRRIGKFMVAVTLWEIAGEEIGKLISQLKQHQKQSSKFVIDSFNSCHESPNLSVQA